MVEIGKPLLPEPKAGVQDVRELINRRRAVIDEAVLWNSMHKTNPVCQKCIVDDYDAGKLQKIDTYATMKKTREAMGVESTIKGVVMTQCKLVDWKCPRGHGVTINWSSRELETTKK